MGLNIYVGLREEGGTLAYDVGIEVKGWIKTRGSGTWIRGWWGAGATKPWCWTCSKGAALTHGNSWIFLTESFLDKLGYITEGTDLSPDPREYVLK